MGKIIQVKATVATVTLPPLGIPYLAGEVHTLTDAEYTGLSAAAKNSITIITSGVPDPVRSTNYSRPSTATDALRLANQYTDEAVKSIATIGNNPPSELATITEVNTALVNAKSYSDSKLSAAIATEVTNRNTADGSTLTSANAYTNSRMTAEQARTATEDAATLQSAHAYTDNVVASERVDRTTGDTNTLASAKSYTDTQLSTATNSSQAADTATLNAAKDYADRGLPLYAKGLGLTNLYDPIRNVYNWKSSNTSRIRAGLGRAAASGPDAGLCRIAIFGDSKSDQYNGSNAANGGYDTSFTKWPYVMLDRAANLSGAPIGGTGYVKAWHAGVYDPRWTVSGPWTVLLAGCYSYTSVLGSSMTFSTLATGETGTVVNVMYDDYEFGQIDISVDGATSGPGHSLVTCTNTSAWKVATLTGLSDTTHSVKITAVAGAYVFISGAGVRKSTGLIVDNYAINGGSSNLYPPAQVLGGVAKFYTPDPDGIIMPLGINDMNAQGLTQAQVIANYTAVRSAYPNTDLIMVAEDLTTAYTQSAWDSYVGALYRLADTLDVPLVDWRARLVSPAVASANHLMFDGVHQNAAGDADLGRSMATLLAT